MHITGTHIAYLRLCHRKLWLFAHGINMEHGSELVAEGRFIDEHSYPQRAARWQALEIEGIRIDHYDAKAGIVREVKKSNKREDAHRAQLQFYLFVLERNGVSASHGILEYPRLRETEEVWLTDEARREIPLWEAEAQRIIALENCPPLARKGILFNFLGKQRIPVHFFDYYEHYTGTFQPKRVPAGRQNAGGTNARLPAEPPPDAYRPATGGKRQFQHAKKHAVLRQPGPGDGASHQRSGRPPGKHRRRSGP